MKKISKKILFIILLVGITALGFGVFAPKSFALNNYIEYDVLSGEVSPYTIVYTIPNSISSGYDNNGNADIQLFTSKPFADDGWSIGLYYTSERVYNEEFNFWYNRAKLYLRYLSLDDNLEPIELIDLQLFENRSVDIDSSLIQIVIPTIYPDDWNNEFNFTINLYEIGTIPNYAQGVPTDNINNEPSPYLDIDYIDSAFCTIPSPYTRLETQVYLFTRSSLNGAMAYGVWYNDPSTDINFLEQQTKRMYKGQFLENSMIDSYMWGFSNGLDNNGSGGDSGGDSGGLWTSLTPIFDSVGTILSYELFPNITIGLIILVPLVLGMISLILVFWRKD